MSAIHEEIAARLEKMAPEPEKDMRGWLKEVPELRQLIIGALIRGLAATKCHYEMKSKMMVYEPDFQAQNKAAALLVAYSDGLPTQSTVNLNLDAAKTGLTMTDALNHSPALRDFIRSELDKVDQKAIAV